MDPKVPRTAPKSPPPMGDTLQKRVSPEPQQQEAPDLNTYAPIIIGLLVILFTLLLIFLYKKKKAAHSGVLFTGLCDSGKTLLYSRLVHRRFALTQTSIQENIDDYSINGKSVKIIDIPGHERLRGQFLDAHKTKSRGIVYVIDSHTIQKDIRDVAEFLYNILTDAAIYSNSPGILILCNKQDQPMVKNSNAIRTMLEKEINTLKITKSNQLESVDPNSKIRNVQLTYGNEAFTFKGIQQYRIDFADVFATNGEKECNITPLEKWLASIA